MAFLLTNQPPPLANKPFGDSLTSMDGLYLWWVYVGTLRPHTSERVKHPSLGHHIANRHRFRGTLCGVGVWRGNRGLRLFQTSRNWSSEVDYGESEYWNRTYPRSVRPNAQAFWTLYTGISNGFMTARV